MKLQVRSLNEAGISEFSAWLHNPACDPPKKILTDITTSDVVDGEYRLDVSKTFANSYELGEYLAKHVFVSPVDRSALLSDKGMWAWLSLAFIESLIRKGRRAGAGKPLAAAHYLVQSPRLSYRLIVRTAWDLVSLHGTAAKIAIGSSKSPWGEMAEQMTSSQEIYAHKSFWPVANLLYATPDGLVKSGAASQRPREARLDPKSKLGLGCVRRLPLTFKQFERTYNLRGMTGEEIAALLPGEYSKWLKS